MTAAPALAIDSERIEVAVYLAPAIAPLSPLETASIRQQTAALIGVDAQRIEPVFVELHPAAALDQDFSWVPETEVGRAFLLSLVGLLRDGARPIGRHCCLLIYDAHSSFAAIDHLNALAEITQLQVLLGVLQDTSSEGASTAERDRRVLVRRRR